MISNPKLREFAEENSASVAEVVAIPRLLLGSKQIVETVILASGRAAQAWGTVDVLDVGTWEPATKTILRDPDGDFLSIRLDLRGSIVSMVVLDGEA